VRGCQQLSQSPSIWVSRLGGNKGKQYWKQHYNTPLGKGTVTKYVDKVQKIPKEAQGQ